MSDYPKGNPDVLKMFESGLFDDSLAKELLSGVDLNSPIGDLSGFSTTYLYEAVAENNLPAVDYLLKHGADPNLKCDGESLYDWVTYKVYNDLPSDDAWGETVSIFTSCWSSTVEEAAMGYTENLI